MHDLSFFRGNLDAISQRLATRGFQLDIAEFRELDAQRRSALTEAEDLKRQVNEESQEIGKLKRQGADTTAHQERVRTIKDRIAALDANANELEDSFRALLAG